MKSHLIDTPQSIPSGLSWPKLYEYTHAPHREHKSEEEIRSDARVLQGTRPLRCCLGDTHKTAMSQSLVVEMDDQATLV